MRLRFLLSYTVAASVDWHYMTLCNHCQKAGRSTSVPDRAAPESYIAQLFPHRPPMAMAEAQIAILKVIVAAQFFSNCYFKVQLLHDVTLISHSNLAISRSLSTCLHSNWRRSSSRCC